ncbi:O-acyltransferase (WSD1-like) family protein [Medicago truncatula]|uniref:O-acyltransferase (WSD1-like) family protein n=1 Tax=Medicago truncatula TaxID=3880 RepID=A0A072VE45_MEDTR|nr:O-acyltransferase (WSD1-like) family protein [Medicago truncatula]
MACSSEGGGEPLSPAARLFHSPSFNCYVIAIIGCKTSINPQVIRDGLCQTILKHPRFTSKLDTHTPLKGAHGVELNTKRFVYLMVSMDDIKLVKAEMKTTINDVLLGLTQAGLARYLNREYGVKNANDGAAMSKSGIPKNIRLRASILVNIRASPGIQDLADMMAEKGKARWGNKMGYIIFPFNIALQEDPLEYVRQAKATIDRKKQSLEAICSYACAKLVLNLFGVKIAGVITRRVLFHTTMAFSNVAGPVEEISFYGHPVAFIAPSVYGHPHALTIHFQSYANQMTISMAVDPTIIPDPYLLCDDFEESLKLICDNVVKKRHIAEII